MEFLSNASYLSKELKRELESKFNRDVNPLMNKLQNDFLIHFKNLKGASEYSSQINDYARKCIETLKNEFGQEHEDYLQHLMEQFINRL